VASGSIRRLVSAVTADDISTLTIRKILRPSKVSLWVSCVTVTDTIGLFQGDFEIVPASTGNVRAAAVGLVLISDDQLLFDHIVLPAMGELKVPVATLTTSLIYILSVEPVA